MDEKIQALANLLQETGQAHHQAFIETDGADDDWAIWYADYLIEKLHNILEARLTRTQLVVLMVELDRLHKATAPGSNWAQFYAKELINRYF